MIETATVEELVAEIADAKLGDIKRRAKAIKKEHDLALELWATGGVAARLLATLVLDGTRLTLEAIEALAADILEHPAVERDQLADWLLANQLTKVKALVSLIETWENHPSPVLRRWFWYHQARLRWTGQTPPDNTEHLMASLEKTMAHAEPPAQWAMNFCAGQIGIHESAYRTRCIELGERTGLYADEKVAKNCVPSYLPQFIAIEVAKRER